MSEGGIRWMYFDAFSSKSSDRNILINTYEQGCSIAFWCRSFTGKERDEETGYGYFGARYMDHELMTMWLSVDPMADKYPSISPYAYCAWNPVKLIDPDGKDWYRSDETGVVLWKNSSAVKVDVNGEPYRNIGTTYQQYLNGELITYGNSIEGHINPDPDSKPDPSLNLEGGQFIPSQFYTDDGTKVSVSFNANANNSIDPNTVTELITSVNQANNDGAGITSLYISCTTNHTSNSDKSAHQLKNGARGLDVSMVNNIPVSTSNVEAKALQLGIQKTPGWMENYGPFIIQRAYPNKVVEAPWARTICPDGHMTHIHLSTPNYD